MYSVLVKESIMSGLFALLGVLIIIFLISGSLTSAIVVCISVLLVDFFLVALIDIWGLTFNNIVVVHLLASIAISALYSLLVAMNYMMVEAPSHLPKHKQRMYRARLSISQTSSSVVHGIIASLITLSMVAIVQQSYILEVFVRIWFGAILFSTLNAYLLVPTVLSLVGPIRRIFQKRATRKIFDSCTISMQDSVLDQTERPFRSEGLESKVGSEQPAFEPAAPQNDSCFDDDDDKSVESVLHEAD